MSTCKQFTTCVSSTPIVLPPPSADYKHPRDKARAYDTYVATQQTRGLNITIALYMKCYHENLSNATRQHKTLQSYPVTLS